MRWLLTSLLMLFASAASAAPSCLPSSFGSMPIGGSGSPVKVVPTSGGTGYVWKCPDGTMPWKAVADDYEGPPASTIVAQIRSYASLAEAMREMWTMFDTPVCSPSVPESCSIFWTEVAQATVAAGASINFGWTVAKNGSNISRPAFAVVNGVRSFSSKVAVAVGSPCDCTLKIVEGSITYCGVGPLLVSSCSPTP